jgi:hypothetical protein
MTIKRICFCFAVIVLLQSTVVTAQSQNVKVRSAETILKDGPYSFPEKVAVDGTGTLYVLDSQLSNVFVVRRTRKGREAKALCSPRTPINASDLTVDSSSGVWILSTDGLQVVKLDQGCKVAKSFKVRRPALSMAVNSAAEIVVLTSTGQDLFDAYDQDGNLLRSFGRRISYGDPITEGELNNGRLVADRNGGFYFSFNYPPLVQHYGRDGKLLGEFKPPSEVQIGPPTVSSHKQGNLLAVRANYQILVLDFTLDARGRLVFLMSGKPKFEAIGQGSQTLVITSNSGKPVEKVSVEDAAFHRLTAGRTGLYLLRNRDGLRLDRYQLP